MLDKFNKIKRKVNSDITNKVIKNKRSVKYKRSDNSEKRAIEQVKNSLPVKIMGCILIGIIGLFGVFLFAGAFSNKISTILWKKLIIPCHSIIFSISQYLVFKLGKTIFSPILYLGIFLSALLIINILLEFVIPMEKNKKYKKLNLYRFLLLLVSCFMFFISGFVFLDYNNPKLDTLYFPKQEKKKYKVDDIIKLDEEMKNKVIAYSKLMNRDKNNSIIYNGDIIDTAITDLENASSNYDILKGTYPHKFYAFNDSDIEYNPDANGLTKSDNVGVNYNLSTPILLNTITHELCHTRGIVRENDAVLCSVMVGIESDNLLSNYGAYIEAFFRTNDALSYIDSEKALAYKNEVFDLCINDHYEEICNLYRKDTKLYVNKSDSISIGTYKLKSYDKEYINELIDSLKKYKPELYINSSKKIKRNKLDGYFEDDNAYLEIRIKNSDDDFVKVKKILDKYSSRVRYIYQEYDNMYDGLELSNKEAIKYYTASVPRGNVFSIGKRGEMFDYTRVARLLLEYFDSKNV